MHWSVGRLALYLVQNEGLLSAGKADKTRPDTWPIPVADGWAGAEMRFFTLFDSCSRTDRPTNGQMEGRTKPLIELRVRN